MLNRVMFFMYREEGALSNRSCSTRKRILLISVLQGEANNAAVLDAKAFTICSMKGNICKKLFCRVKLSLRDPQNVEEYCLFCICLHRDHAKQVCDNIVGQVE